MKDKIKADIEKFMKFQKFFLGTKEKVDLESIDTRGYARYVLKQGSDVEKRELLACFKGNITIKQKILSFNN